MLARRASEPDWLPYIVPCTIHGDKVCGSWFMGALRTGSAPAWALNNAAIGPAPASTVGVVRCRYVAEVTRVLAWPSTSATSSNGPPAADSRLAAERRSSCGCQRPRSAFSVTVARARRRQEQARTHPLPQALPRTRDLPCPTNRHDQLTTVGASASPGGLGKSQPGLARVSLAAGRQAARSQARLQERCSRSPSVCSGALINVTARRAAHSRAAGGPRLPRRPGLRPYDG